MNGLPKMVSPQHAIVFILTVRYVVKNSLCLDVIQIEQSIIFVAENAKANGCQHAWGRKTRALNM